MALTKVAVRTPEQVLAEHLDSWEAHVSEWISRRDAVTRNQFVMGLIASSVVTKYGEKSLAQFAIEVNESLSTVYRYRDVYRKCFEFSLRVENLNWSHFALIVEAGVSDDEREQLLAEAAESGWSARQLKREVGLRRITQEKSLEVPHLDPQMASAISHWRELKPQVEKFAKANPQFTLYVEDFIGDVDEVMDEPWDSARAFIERLIYAGCREVDALAKASHWRKETVERLCDELVAVGSHEWREQGGKTDDARGARRRLIVSVEEPSGESYQGSRMGMIVEDDDEL